MIRHTYTRYTPQPHPALSALTDAEISTEMTAIDDRADAGTMTNDDEARYDTLSTEKYARECAAKAARLNRTPTNAERHAAFESAALGEW